eukprot:250627-Chlamydomonas_euryale.AAC.2
MVERMMDSAPLLGCSKKVASRKPDSASSDAVTGMPHATHSARSSAAPSAKPGPSTARHPSRSMRAPSRDGRGG